MRTLPRAPRYIATTAICHGLPGQPEGGFAKGRFPHPPKLTDGKGVTDDEPGEPYWKVANRIRFTGMPSFRPSLSEAEMWQVSLLAARADKLPQAAKDVLSAPMFGGPRPGTNPPGMKAPGMAGLIAGRTLHLYILILSGAAPH